MSLSDGTGEKAHVCKDCIAEGIRTNRPAPYAGPRCKTHHLARRRLLREKAWARHLWSTYHITPEQYDAIYKAQGGRCYGCRRATGTGRKKLSVDHDHSCCPGPISCGKCVRGLLCTPCNKGVLGHLRDEVAAFERFIEYLKNPPARGIIND